jgi:hypothetical protein
VNRTDEQTADDQETFQACTDCFLPIFSSKVPQIAQYSSGVHTPVLIIAVAGQAGVNAVVTGNRSEVQEQVEQLILSLASKDQEAREKALWAVITIVGLEPTADPRGRTRLFEMAHTLWDGLGSLQILLEANNIYAPLVNIIREVTNHLLLR